MRTLLIVMFALLSMLGTAQDREYSGMTVDNVHLFLEALVTNEFEFPQLGISYEELVTKTAPMDRAGIKDSGFEEYLPKWEQTSVNFLKQLCGAKKSQFKLESFRKDREEGSVKAYSGVFSFQCDKKTEVFFAGLELGEEFYLFLVKANN